MNPKLGGAVEMRENTGSAPLPTVLLYQAKGGSMKRTVAYLKRALCVGVYSVLLCAPPWMAQRTAVASQDPRVEIAAVGTFSTFDGETTALSLPSSGGITTSVEVVCRNQSGVASVRLTGANNSPLTTTFADDRALFTGVQLASGSVTLTAQALNGGGNPVGDPHSVALSITACTVSSVVYFQAGGKYVVNEVSGDLIGGLMAEVVSSSVASLRLSGAGLSSPVTQSVSGPGTYEFGGVEFAVGSNTITLTSLDSGGGTLDSRSVVCSFEGIAGFSGQNMAAAAQVKKRVRLCIKNSDTQVVAFCVSFADGYSVICKSVAPGMTWYFTKVEPDPVGTPVRILVTVNGQTVLDKTVTVRA